MRFVSITLLLVCCSAGVIAQPTRHPKLAPAQADFRAASQRRDTLAMAEAAYSMGKHTRASNDFVGGRNWLLYALRIWEKRGPSVDLNRVYVQLASDGPTTGNFPEAFVYANRALSNSRQLNHPHSLMSAHWMLGTLHLWRAKQDLEAPTDQRKTGLDSAAWHLQQAEAIGLKIGKTIDIAGIRNARADLLAESNPAQAIPLWEYALREYTKARKGLGVVYLHHRLSMAFLAVSNRRKAYYHLRTADSVSRRFDDITLEQRMYGQYAWAKWYETTRQWSQAYERLRLADSLRQCVLTTEQRAAIARLNIAYETNRRDKLLLQRETELSVTKQVLIAQQQYTYGAFGLLVLSAVVGGLFYRLGRQNKRISRQNAQLLEEQSHRMKNHLQAISGLLSLQASQVTDADAKRAMEESQIRIQTMALLNRKLGGSDNQPLQNLPELIPEVIRMILRSYGNEAVAVNYQIEQVPISVEQLLPVILIVNELVTNACKYAFPDHPDPALFVRCWRDGNRIWLLVQDNGPGIQPDQLMSGFGLRLIALQTQQLWAESTFSAPPGLTFHLSIPVNT